jgi:tetratricopeptide (TPR) repeat protein
MLGQAADAAIRQGSGGRELLLQSLREQCDLLRQAFAHAEAGRDEEARAALQGIGLQSPFLEWKLFLRGLLAYYQNDDARALENWNRLNSERMPFRLTGPFRFLIDPAFRQAQAPEAQTKLQRAADQLQGAALTLPLRAVQSAIGSDKQLPHAFRLAESLLPALRQQAPALAQRLAWCFYWALVSHGNPEDMNRYRRVFGAPPDDPDLLRLQALALERRGNLASAHDAWKDFQEWLANDSTWGSLELRQRARALVWSHMGVNAGHMSENSLPPFLPFKVELPSIEPGAEHCFQKSLTLAPDRLEAHKDLFDYYWESDEPAKAIAAGEVLLTHFPDHVPTLEAMAGLWHEKKDYEKALWLLERALQVNPLERRLRLAVADAHMFVARDLAGTRRLDEARAEYRASLTLQDPRGKPGVLCRWSACEFKAKDAARAEELLLQARAEGGSPAYVAYYMTIEAIRCKLPAPLKRRFSEELAVVLNEPPTVAAALEMLDLAVSHYLSEVAYVGRKTHEKKILVHVERALALPWTEDELERLCTGLGLLKEVKLLKKAIRRGKTQYPNSPVFPLKNAFLHINLGPRRGSIWEIGHSLETAQELAEDLPADDRQRRFFREIQEMRKLVEGFSPFGPGRIDLNDMMDAFFDE